MRTALFACLMGATIIVSVPQALRADDDHRYYDRDWAHATAVEQRDYWRWRHDHPDWH